MALWMVRGDKFGQYQETALEKGFAYHASSVPDLGSATTREAVFEHLRNLHPEGKENQLLNWSSQLFALAHRIKKDDLVVMPLRGKEQIALGRAKGTYLYRKDLGEVHHTIPVEWLREGVPRSTFGQDLLYSFGAFMTVCEVKRHNAEERVRKVIDGKADPGPETEVGPDPEPVVNGFIDVEQIARDQILNHLEKNFKGHDLARLVEALLQAEGFMTKLSPPGPDGGVDILAGRGALGLEGPKVCAQVKSSSSPADVNILRALQGTMHNFKADQGLLVSWGGFTKAVESEARLSFFSVRLWDASDLIEALLKYYDRLPEDLQAELPLKRIWTLVIEE